VRGCVRPDGLVEQGAHGLRPLSMGSLATLILAVTVNLIANVNL
jgi:hypothetical protein